MARWGARSIVRSQPHRPAGRILLIAGLALLAVLAPLLSFSPAALHAIGAPLAALGDPWYAEHQLAWAASTLDHPPPATLPTTGNGTNSTNTTYVWTNLTAGLSSTPPCRGSGGLVYDAADGYVLLFTGAGGCLPYTMIALNDTWKFQNGSWTDLTANFSVSPPARFQAATTYDGADGYVLLFGGETTSYSLGDTWEYHGGAWQQVITSPSPSPRFHGSIAYDAADGDVVLFGGSYWGTSGTMDGDTWTYVQGTWTLVSSGTSSDPMPRRAAGMAYDGTDGYVVLFGGVTGSVVALSDTWKFSNGSWTQLNPSPHPTARWDLWPTTDPDVNGALFFGGCYHTGCTSVYNDTWAFSGGNWTQLTVWNGTAPSARGATYLAYDPDIPGILLFGGSAGRTLNDTWTFTVRSGGNGSGSGNGSGGNNSGGNSSGGCGSGDDDDNETGTGGNTSSGGAPVRSVPGPTFPPPPASEANGPGTAGIAPAPNPTATLLPYLIGVISGAAGVLAAVLLLRWPPRRDRSPPE
jgi:Galactose oxidase, central domain